MTEDLRLESRVMALEDEMAELRQAVDVLIENREERPDFVKTMVESFMARTRAKAEGPKE